MMLRCRDAFPSGEDEGGVDGPIDSITGRDQRVETALVHQRKRHKIKYSPHHAHGVMAVHVGQHPVVAIPKQRPGLLSGGTSSDEYVEHLLAYQSFQKCTKVEPADLNLDRLVQQFLIIVSPRGLLLMMMNCRMFLLLLLLARYVQYDPSSVNCEQLEGPAHNLALGR